MANALAIGWAERRAGGGEEFAMRASTVVLATLAAAAAGFSLFALLAPPPPPGTTPQTTPETAAAPPSPAAEPPAEAATGPADEAASEDAEAGAAALPSFDVVRVDRDGAAVAAGSAAPHAEVRIRIDGETRATARADASGGFVAFFDVPGAEGEGAVRRLDLEAVGADGAATGAAEPVIVAAPAADEPDAEPLVVAARETGVEVLQKPGAAAGEGAVTLDSAAQDASGVVALTGRAGGLKPVRIYANARLVAETVADADGRWSAEASADETAGAATLRVDEIAADGSVSRRIEAPFVALVEEAIPGPGEIIVRKGDTLWRIAENLLGDGPRFTVIYEANADRIRDPDLIFPGQLLSVPAAAQ
jgi:nucleoid-associated protein YgaU